MNPGLPRLKLHSRAKHCLLAQDVDTVLCHRSRDGIEEFLIKWKSRQLRNKHFTVYSWHSLEELRRCLHFIQIYVEKQPQRLISTPSASSLPTNRKRKTPDDEHVTSRVWTHDGPGSPMRIGSRSPSVISISSSTGDGTPMVYNGVLKRKEGRISATVVRSRFRTLSLIEAECKKYDDLEKVASSPDEFPTRTMLEAAARTPIVNAGHHIQQAFAEKLELLRGVSLENKIDESTPSLDFTFIESYVLAEGVYAADPDSFEGCDKPCRPDMGQDIGCEYTRECGCLEYAAVDEDALKRQSPEVYERYQAVLTRGEYPDTLGLPKRFPYHKPSRNGPGVSPTLQAHYRESRHPIYECNQNCNCGPRCKSRLVQKGRRVPLTIFKTRTRGWGVYCGKDLSPGEFIDTYLGEVITNEEADRRESTAGKEKASYLYNLDKFAGSDDDDLTPESCFVVDGEYMGGPTRFINHSCEPNCRQYTVSYNKNDRRLYDLAFFAYEYIPAGTELTFDYMDKDEEEEEDVIRMREEAANDPNNVDKTPCLCGSKKCRGYLWFSG